MLKNCNNETPEMAGKPRRRSSVIKKVVYQKGQLVQAAKQGDCVLIRQLISNGGKVNETDVNGSTPLHHAVYIYYILYI